MSDINVQSFSGKVNISNNLKVGSGHLFVDTQNNQVGLNTDDPQANLHVNGNTYVHSDLRVGSDIEMNVTPGQITAGSFVTSLKHTTPRLMKTVKPLKISICPKRLMILCFSCRFKNQKITDFP